MDFPQGTPSRSSSTSPAGPSTRPRRRPTTPWSAPWLCARAARPRAGTPPPTSPTCSRARRFASARSPTPAAFPSACAPPPKTSREGFRLLHLLLTDSKLEKPAVDRWRQRMHQMLEMQKKSVQEMARETMQSFLGDDPRFKSLTPERVDAIDAQAAHAWVKRVIATAPVEMVVVGDTDQKTMLDLAAKYNRLAAQAPGLPRPVEGAQGAKAEGSHHENGDRRDDHPAGHPARRLARPRLGRLAGGTRPAIRLDDRHAAHHEVRPRGAGPGLLADVPAHAAAGLRHERPDRLVSRATRRRRRKPPGSPRKRCWRWSTTPRRPMPRWPP